MSKLNHRNSRQSANHSLYQSNLLADHTQLLTDIKTNTSNVNVNTDTLETILTTANTSHSNNLTKLTNIQTITDTKLSAIQNFLDKDHAQFHLKHHPDDHHVMLAGNTSADGTGTKHHAHVDSNGVLSCKSMGLNDAGNNQQIKTDNSGNVSAFLVSDVIMKPSNITNGDHASFSGSSVASMLRGRTNITDNSTGTFLLCNSEGHLKVENSLTTTQIGSSLSLATGVSTDSSVLEVKNKTRGISFILEASDIGSNYTVTFSVSPNNGTYYPLASNYVTSHDSGNSKQLIIKDFEIRYIKMVITQSTGSTKTVDVYAHY